MVAILMLFFNTFYRVVKVIYRVFGEDEERGNRITN